MCTLQLFYDADILEEKAFDEWSNKVSKKYVSKDLSQEIHDRAAPFLTWLKVAEEEESESEEEDDDVEVISLFTSASKKIINSLIQFFHYFVQFFSINL